MRLLLSKSSRKNMILFLMKKYHCVSIRKLSNFMNIPFRTFQEWIYNKKRYIPEEIIPLELVKELDILDKKEDGWGRVKGGKNTYKLIIKKYGIEEIRKRQSKGGRNSAMKRKQEPFNLDIKDSLFLEFYGVLIGDGWIGRYKYKNKIIRLIGISGHSRLDRDFFLYLKENIRHLFNRKAYLKERHGQNSIELQFSHVKLFDFLSSEIDFPIGKKINLKIDKKILDLGFNNLRYVIRGIFDTDGCFYYDKTPAGRPYPCISIKMKAPILIRQIKDILLDEGFKVIYKENSKEGQSRITLKGSKQLKKWMKEIGSSNPKHLDKMPR